MNEAVTGSSYEEISPATLGEACQTIGVKSNWVSRVSNLGPTDKSAVCFPPVVAVDTNADIFKVMSVCLVGDSYRLTFTERLALSPDHPMGTATCKFGDPLRPPQNRFLARNRLASTGKERRSRRNEPIWEWCRPFCANWHSRTEREEGRSGARIW
jgi:hypothetical protein